MVNLSKVILKRHNSILCDFQTIQKIIKTIRNYESVICSSCDNNVGIEFMAV